MVNQFTDVPTASSELDHVFLALSDSTRRGMLNRLTRGAASVGELGRPYSITAPAVTKHVKVLERAGLVRREREGRVHRISLRPGAMRAAEEWLEAQRRFWEGSLDRLTAFVEQSMNPTGEGE